MRPGFKNTPPWFHTNQNSDFVVGNNSKFKMILIENANIEVSFPSRKQHKINIEQVGLPIQIFVPMCWVVVLDLDLPLKNGMITFN